MQYQKTKNGEQIPQTEGEISNTTNGIQSLDKQEKADTQNTIKWIVALVICALCIVAIGIYIYRNKKVIKK